MIGGLKQTTSRLAIAAAAGLFTGGVALTPVLAADLGGDCCADLEERVAELEATTVRKGNRKVSVKLSGQVNRMVLHWDDGFDEDVFFTDNETSNTRFRLTGSATISPGRTAGFRLEQDINISNNSSVVSNCGSTIGGRCQPIANQEGNNTTNNDIDTRYMDLWFKDERLGKFSLGQGDMASNGTSQVDLSGTGIVTYSSSSDIGGNFHFRVSGTGADSGVTLGTAISDLDGASRQDRIRYDTPSLGGFTFSTSYAADDIADAAVRFKKEWNSVRCAAALGYDHDTQEKNDDFEIWSSSGSCIHTPSGLNLTLGWAEKDNGNSSTLDQEWFYAKLGISRRWNSHGKTSISISYGESDNVTSAQGSGEATAIAIVQNIDSAALELYAAWIHNEYSDNTATSFEDLDFLSLGARMRF
jgi:hypothetical protein